MKPILPTNHTAYEGGPGIRYRVVRRRAFSYVIVRQRLQEMPPVPAYPDGFLVWTRECDAGGHHDTPLGAHNEARALARESRHLAAGQLSLDAGV